MRASPTRCPNESQYVVVQPLEERRMFSFVFISFGGAPLPDNDFGLPLQDLALPAQAASLPHQALALPTPFSPVVTPFSDFNVKGSFHGSATLTGFGSTSLDLTITRQRRGNISGTLTFPTFGKTISGTVPITFTGNRRFSTTIVQNGDSATLVARLKRDNTVKGEFAVSALGQKLSGTFAMAKIS